MRSRKAPAVILALLLVAGFGCGLLRLFHLRYAVGDVYPPYSSLRADPLGAKALHDALEELPGLSVRRNVEGLSREVDAPGTALLVLGHGPHSLDATDPSFTDSLESLALHGARVVLSFAPVVRETWQREFEKEKKKQEKEEQEKESKEKQEPKPPVLKKPGPPPTGGPGIHPPGEDELSEERLRRASFLKRWGFKSEYDDLPLDAQGRPQAVVARRVAPLDLPGALSWHTSLYFRDLDPAWRVIYARGDEAVLIERPLGRGRLVLSADTYFLSNEAMLKERRPEILSWILGDKRTVVFDETHLGIEEQPGVAALARRYRLHGLAAGILLLAGLFLWQAAARFVPPLPEGGAGDTVAGKDAAAGFVNLLQRGIPPGEILRVCVDEWARSLERGPAIPPKSLQRLAAGSGDPVEGYRRVSRALSRAKIPRATRAS